jgi:hypothetical protein
MAQTSRHSASLPYIVLSVAIVFIAIRAYLYHFKFLLADILAITLFAVIVVSNQYPLSQRMGNGDLDIEFKHLTEWYRANAKPGELIVTTMTGNCGIFDPSHKDCYINTASIIADSPEEFATECYRKNITYIAWDSRIGMAKENRYYNLWRIENTDQLEYGESVGPYEYITTLEGSSMYEYPRVIHIYRLNESALQAF